jgi:mRNA-decapping enzyme subunit 2
VHGAIILNETLDECVLVQGYWSKSSWSFPKGKVNHNETEFDCAVREVKEETGLDVEQYANPKHFLQHRLNDQEVRLYIVPGVPKSTNLKPLTRNEIRKIQWFPLKSLPSHKGDTISQKTLGLNWNNFFQVIPFLK